MAYNDVVQFISHYQRDIEKITSRPERLLKYEDRLLHCLTKLHKLPVTVSHLQETGVGKTVNSLRKYQGKNGLGEAAKALVAKWKAMVIEEEGDVGKEENEKSAEDTKRSKVEVKREQMEYSPANSNGTLVDYRPSSSNSNQHLNAYSPQSVSQSVDSEASYSPSKKPHQPNGYDPESPSSSNGIEVYCYSPSKKSSSKQDVKRKSSKSESRNDKEESSSKRKMKEEDQKKAKKESSHEKSSRRENSKHSSSSISSKHDNKERSSSKEKHSSSSKSLSISEKKSKTSISPKKEEKVKQPADEEVDSMSGASFAEALGPMIKKKSSSASSTKKKSKPEASPIASCSTSKYSSSSMRSKPASTSKEVIPVKQLLDDVAGPSHLTPLDIDVVSTLSVPTPNYRPMPQPVLTLAERRRNNAEVEDALAKIMSNKNTRTKVYSGVKGGLTYVPSLYDICCRVLQQHIDALEYTGGIPYSLLKPIVDAATPPQLYQFEHFNPYIIEDTDHLWQFHVNREFRGESREEMESWRDMYLRCVDEREQRYKAVTANIQESLKKSVPVRQTKLAYVDVAKPPRNILKRQMKNGTSKPDAARLLGKNDPDAVAVRAPHKTIAPVRDIPAAFKLKPRVAPLMQKTLKSIKSTHFRR